MALAILEAATIATFSSKARSTRAFLVAAIAAAVLTAWCVRVTDLRFNLTPSMPLGIYRLIPIAEGAIRRGMLVEACAPSHAAELGRRRGYLGRGVCPRDAEPLLKRIVACSGDDVVISEIGVAVNSEPLPHSAPLSVDVDRRPLTFWKTASYRLRRGEIWLYADNVRSWDSRYWGPISATDVLAQAFPILTFPSIVRNDGKGSVFAEQCTRKDHDWSERRRGVAAPPGIYSTPRTAFQAIAASTTGNANIQMARSTFVI
jgi:conjugative transfer signal peptidase TraF